MKRYILLLLILMLPQASWAGVELNGYIETDNRVGLENSKITMNENTLQLKLATELSPEVSAFAKVDLVGAGKSSVSNIKESGRIEEVDPFRIEFKEAYINFYGFLLPDLDLRVGKQRIAWGTADRLNPTDNLNPQDLSDPMDFGEKLTSNSIKTEYCLQDYTITGVYIPVFLPPLSPPDNWIPERLRIATTTICLPQEKTNNSMYGLKIAGKLLDYNISLSYFNGISDVQTIKTMGTSGIEFIYPKVEVIGFDLAGQIKKVGVWAEAGYFIPEKMLKEYVRYVLGADYTFKNGVYINAQFLHGFDDEQGEDELRDYIMTGIRKKFLEDELKLEVRLGEDIDGGSFVVWPEVIYYPQDAVEIALGCYIIDGDIDSKFGPFKENDEVYLKVKYSF